MEPKLILEPPLTAFKANEYFALTEAVLKQEIQDKVCVESIDSRPQLCADTESHE
jgi:hypothetical protein